MAMDNPPEVRQEFLPEAFDDKIRENLDHVESAATKKAHASDWRDFSNWCSERGLSSCPADPRTVAGYISELAAEGYAVSTITRKLATISVMHSRRGFDSPTGTEGVRAVLKGIRNRYGTAKVKKSPFRITHVRQLPALLDESNKSTRDFCLVVFGYAGAFRRSELVNLDVEDIEFVQQGIRATIRRGKTDQGGASRTIDISNGANARLCPVVAMRKWLDLAGFDKGPIFRPIDRHGNIAERRLGDKAVSEILKSFGEKLGLDPSKIGAHSLRSGMITDAFAAGVPSTVIRRFSGHKTDLMLSEYFLESTMFQVNLSAAVGL